ncbi:MAG: succinate dehydrogenase/fumarate reductase iron-sulfur subunit [Dehalococcoidaceae bacterium]|nr:succinate dehydrogenase/fumarate reductase iron-sulfur subunit [Dehalococcoidaceae bacterium]|tara:strand:- start:908 stop:1657 length:750 start_codon:yes stop_codon:yes gene_type:complete
MPVVELRVWRGGDDGEYQTFHVEYDEGEVILDVVHRLQSTQVPDLAVRWNCKAGKCGSCSAEVNGKPSLMCMTRMQNFTSGDVITISPMKTFPLIKDLVTDVSWNYENARKVPHFNPKERDADGKHRMMQLDIERGQEFHQCIECYLCQDVCHVIRDHPENKENFVGPRFFVQMAQVNMHPLESESQKPDALEGYGLDYCNITKCCTDVCPAGIKITDNAIIPLKERLIDDKFDPLRWLGRKIKNAKSE